MESFSLLKLSPHTSYQGELKGRGGICFLQGKVKWSRRKTLGEIAQRKSIFEDKASAFTFPRFVTRLRQRKIASLSWLELKRKKEAPLFPSK